MKSLFHFIHLFLFCGFWKCGIVEEEGGGMSDEQFRSTVLKGVKSVSEEVKATKTQQQQLLENYDQLHKDTKSAMEELTKVKNAQNSMAEMEIALRKVNLQLRREQRMGFVDPLQRILADEEKVAKINAIARALYGHPLNDAHKKALGEDTSPGSTLIDDELANDIYDTLATYGKWNTLGVQRMGKKITKMPVSTARPIAYGILTEGGTIPPDAAKAGTSVSLDAEIIACLLFVSKQLLDDSEFDVASMVLADFREAFNYRLDYMVFQGDGTEDATNVGVTGIFAGATAATAASGNVTVETTDLEDWTKCMLSVDVGVLGRATKWWMNPQNLIRTLGVKDGNGRPIFLTATEAPAPGSIGSILGSPVELVPAAPSTNAAGASVAVYGDPEAYTVGVRQDFVFEQSDEFKFDTLQRAYRCYGRADGKMRRAQGMSRLVLAAS